MEERWSAIVENLRSSGAQSEFTLEEFGSQAGVPTNGSLLQFLDQQVAAGKLERLQCYKCPRNGCVLTTDQLESGECPKCKIDFRREGLEADLEVRYKIVGNNSRDVRWIIIIHGMNSRAAWQEDFTWMVSNKFKYSVPVLVYKYGWMTIDVLVKYRHRQLSRALGNRIKKATRYASERGLTTTPDVIAHSFGSRLFTLVLGDPEFADLRFGRIITAGSIVRPDFVWQEYVDNQRIEAVLNHAGGADLAVPFAQFLIPGSGPGGRVGYLDEGAKNIKTESFEHSSCLTENALQELLIDEGAWDRFLRQPSGEFKSAKEFRPQAWKPALLPLRAFSRIFGTLLFALLSPFVFLLRVVDR